jgi:hypothetical protein
MYDNSGISWICPWLITNLFQKALNHGTRFKYMSSTAEYEESLNIFLGCSVWKIDGVENSIRFNVLPTLNPPVGTSNPEGYLKQWYGQDQRNTNYTAYRTPIARWRQRQRNCKLCRRYVVHAWKESGLYLALCSPICIISEQGLNLIFLSLLWDKKYWCLFHNHWIGSQRTLTKTLDQSLCNCINQHTTKHYASYIRDLIRRIL